MQAGVTVGSGVSDGLIFFVGDGGGAVAVEGTAAGFPQDEIMITARNRNNCLFISPHFCRKPAETSIARQNRPDNYVTETIQTCSGFIPKTILTQKSDLKTLRLSFFESALIFSMPAS
jgi:hypothetical protein